MVKKKIVKIDEEVCIGCGACIAICPTKVLVLDDSKAKLSNPLMCDGLGGCIKQCPVDAISFDFIEVKK